MWGLLSQGCLPRGRGDRCGEGLGVLGLRPLQEREALPSLREQTTGGFTVASWAPGMHVWGESAVLGLACGWAPRDFTKPTFIQPRFSAQPCCPKELKATVLRRGPVLSPQYAEVYDVTAGFQTELSFDVLPSSHSGS